MPVHTIRKVAGESVPIRVWTRDIEPEAMKQLENTSRLPFLFKHVAAMPDVHWGFGATVGSVIATKRALVPAAVGVDIGCGMMALKLNLTASALPESLNKIRSAIEAVIPHGRTDNGGKNDRGAWGELPKHMESAALAHGMDTRLVRVRLRHPKMVKHADFNRHLGTLGTGNHFVEICLDKEQNVWVMLHSGSRGIGNRIGTYFIEQAKEVMERWHIRLADPDLAYLPEDTPLFEDYWDALSWAQDFARNNREFMMQAAVGAVAQELGLKVEDLCTPHSTAAINCHHNYAALENHFGENVYVTRKGAVRARSGDLGIIPGSMGARSFIVRGKGNPDSFHSCSHGAGRKMSRGAARKTFTTSDLEKQTAGVECRKDDGVLDEIPGAYKDIDAVMEDQSDLVEVVAELKQIICVKG